MKKLTIAPFLGLLLVIMVLPVSADMIGTARLGLIQGDVVLQSAGTGDWIAASINIPLLPGDRLWVPGSGRTEIQFLGRAYLRADGNTAVDISNLERDNDNIIQAAVPEGRVYVNHKGYSGRNSVFQIDTPLASAIAYGSSKFGVNVYESGYTEVSVFDGVVHFESQHGNTRVTEGNMISIGPDRYAEISPLRPRDEWVRWNQSRDYQFSRARSSRYLPAELGVYSSDFDDYGRWVYTPDYGYVWTPTAVLGSWAPYRTGRWVWIAGDYVWISYEPWGWTPYHYGRWAHRAHIGWFWVPPAASAVFWAPGLVAWIHTPTYVSWVPLAPRETYYGYGYYGPHSVNITKVNIKNVNITNVYVNSRVRNSVTTVNNETFLTGKPARVAGAPANPFSAGVKVSPGRPAIKPVKATTMPMPTKVVPQKDLPSERVIQITKTTGITKRPVAVRENISVFKPGKQLAPLKAVKAERPRPIGEVQRSEKYRPQVRKELPERPKTMPKETVRQPMQKGAAERPAGISGEGVGKKPVQQQDKVRPYPQKEIKGKPIGVPGKGVERAPVQKKEVEKPSIQRGVKERPGAVPKEGIGKVPQRKEMEKPVMQRGVQERGKSIPRESASRPSVKQKAAEKPSVQMKTKGKSSSKEGVEIMPPPEKERMPRP